MRHSNENYVDGNRFQVNLIRVCNLYSVDDVTVGRLTILGYCLGRWMETFRKFGSLFRYFSGEKTSQWASIQESDPESPFSCDLGSCFLKLVSGTSTNVDRQMMFLRSHSCELGGRPLKHFSQCWLTLKDWDSVVSFKGPEAPLTPLPRR